MHFNLKELYILVYKTFELVSIRINYFVNMSIYNWRKAKLSCLTLSCAMPNWIVKKYNKSKV